MKVQTVLFVFLVALAGCAQRRDVSRVPPAPAGPAPINTGSNDPNLIPAGATIEVRTNENINQDSAAEGRTYPAEITRDIVGGGGRVIVPRGSQARLVVLKVHEGGRITGDRIELGLQSINVNGRDYHVESASRQEGDGGVGANRRTAEMVGGGAVLGTLIGAAAGGGKGAAIGGIVGAAAGAAAQVITKGKEVRIPAETIMTFRLDQPIRLTP